jgi:large subunit ribosomal protein L10
MPEGYAVKVRPEKAEAVEQIRAELDAVQAAVITEYRGLTVKDLATLRTRLSEVETSYRVSKNTLARRAADALGLDGLVEMLEGPVAIAYVKGDPVAAAKVIATFAREHDALVIKGGLLEGRVISGAEAKGLATVDPLDVSRAKIAGLLIAPLRQLMWLLEAPAGRILFVLEEIGKQAPAEAKPEPAPPAEPKAERDQEGDRAEAAAIVEEAKPEPAPPAEPKAERDQEGERAEAAAIVEEAKPEPAPPAEPRAERDQEGERAEAAEVVEEAPLAQAQAERDQEGEKAEAVAEVEEAPTEVTGETQEAPAEAPVATEEATDEPVASGDQETTTEQAQEGE